MGVDGELPWTTSRCNRLLRPLGSKLAKLRKELELPRSTTVEARHVSSAFAIKGSPHKTTNFTRPSYKPRGFDKSRDPDWRPGVTTKKTYGGRGSKRIGLQRNTSDASIASRPGEIAFTPLVARIGHKLHSSPQVQNSPLKKFSKQRGPLLANVESGVAQNLPDDLQKLIRGLLESYANILQATTAGREKRWKGTRSLLGACLRQLPAYIELEEHFAELDQLEEEQDEDRDVANEVYKHLETQFEQRAGQGWRPFKQVVRAHGTSLLCHAIADQVLDLGSLSILVTHCLNVAAWDEGERLLLAYVSLLTPLSFPLSTKADLFDPHKSLYLSIVKNFVDRTGRNRLLYDLLEHMVALELLPLEWLATECMRPVWDRLVRSISDGDSRTNANAFRFMETITLASIGVPDERLLEDETTGSISRRFIPSSREELRQALNTTFSSLLTVLCSIALVNNYRDDPTGRDITRRVTWALDAIVVAILKRQDIRMELKILGAESENVHVFAQRALWANFASVIVRLDDYQQDGAMLALNSTTLIQSVNWIAAQYPSNAINYASVLSGLPSFIASIARGTGRIWKDDGFDQLQRSVTALMAISGCRLPHRLWTLKRLALECAMEFAHDTGAIQHLAYAREIENKMRLQGRLVIAHSPEKNNSPSSTGGFRWEEGIGEWVACTPFVKQDVKRVIRKPVRSLELLPTPTQSEDGKADSSEEYGLLDSMTKSPEWETTAFDYEEDDEAIPHSSPIKQRKRVSSSSLGKRTRSSSPFVVIPAKRVQMTPPDSPVIKFYPLLPEEKEDPSAPRRSRRPRQEIKALTSRLRTQRSRTSLESGLRNIQRATYVDIVPDESDAESYSSSEKDTDSCSASSSARSSRIRPSRSSQRDMSTQESEPETDDADERDELGKTPARPQTRPQKVSKRQVSQATKKHEWWKVKRTSARKVSQRVNYEEEEASEDELSFH